jgi:lipopolysaccharide/colanic/teichoic acid biosynthesis glycosyltransferase
VRFDAVHLATANGNGGAQLLDMRFNARYVRIAVCALTIAVDTLVVVATFFFASFAALSSKLRSDDLLMMLLTVILFVIVSFYARTYSVIASKSHWVAARRVIHAWTVTLALILLVFFTVKSSSSLSRSVFLTSALLGPPLIIAARAAIVTFVRRKLSRQFVCELLVEDGVIVEVPKTFDRVTAAALDLTPDLHNPMNLHNFSCLTDHYDRVLVACHPVRRADWAFYLQSVGCNGELVIPELQGLAFEKGQTSLPTIRVAVGPLELPDRVLKRLLDLFMTVPAIILLSPILLAVAVAVRLDSPGPILFKQTRMGRNNRLFEVYKFRSMRSDQCDLDGQRSASRDDNRITRVGRIIRATSVDELPQLFNVLNGDMALVGPRPHALGSRAGEDLFWDVDHRYWLRHCIKPGITGLAQVRGYRGATDERDDLSNRLYSDLEYLANWSVLGDIGILLRTVKVLVHNKAY